MTREELIAQILSRQSYLCIGLDSDISKIPPAFQQHRNPQAAFNRAIIEATLPHCVAYKINTAFYESQGIRGWEALQETLAAIPSTHFTIADAKRGDIGNTSAQYARAFFEELDFDAVTVNPYMGADSVRPFLDYPGKWTIVLGLTSNPGAADFELLPAGEGLLYQEVLKKAASWGNAGNLMFVIGATRQDLVGSIRKAYPDHFFLVPGVGAQGGDLGEISGAGLNREGGLLVNVSRAVIFASRDQAAEGAALASRQYHDLMRSYLSARPAR